MVQTLSIDFVAWLTRSSLRTFFPRVHLSSKQQKILIFPCHGGNTSSHPALQVGVRIVLGWNITRELPVLPAWTDAASRRVDRVNRAPRGGAVVETLCRLSQVEHLLKAQQTPAVNSNLQ